MNARALRWALLGIFPVGYLVCSAVLGPLDRSFLLLTMVNTGALAFLLARLSGPIEQTLWIWMPLQVLLVGVFLKMFVFASNLNAPSYINATFPELNWVGTQRILDGYPWATLGFVAFCVAGAVLLPITYRIRRQTAVPTNRVLLINSTVQMVIALVIIYSLVTLIQVRLGYGVLGVENPTLPGRLGTVLTFVRQNLVPALLLLAVWLFDQVKPRLADATAVIIIAVSVIDALVSTSRGSVLYLGAPILFLWMITKRVTHRRRVALTACVLVAVVVFPITTALRLNRLDPSSSKGIAFPSTEQLTDSAFSMLARPTGIEGVWYGVDYTASLSLDRTLGFLRPGVMRTFYTRDVVRVRILNDYRAPGLIGSLMITGGGLGVVAGMVGFVGLFSLLWAGTRRLAVAPVAMATVAPLLAVFVSGGTFDFMLIVKLVLSMGVCEVAYRSLSKATRLRQLPGMSLRPGVGSTSPPATVP